jgi:transcriptional regulator with XRE-family HTH domain
VKKQRYGRRYNKLRAILKAARLEAGLTQRQLSGLLKRDKNFAQLVESGERALDAIELIDYARKVRLDPRDVIDEVMK